MSIIRGLWLISRSGPVVLAVSSWARTISPVMATLLTAAILPWIGSHLSQLLFHTAWEKMTAQNPPVTRIKYLGHVLGSGEVYMDKDKVAAVANWGPPQDIK